MAMMSRSVGGGPHPGPQAGPSHVGRSPAVTTGSAGRRRSRGPHARPQTGPERDRKPSRPRCLAGCLAHCLAWCLGPVWTGAKGAMGSRLSDRPHCIGWCIGECLARCLGMRRSCVGVASILRRPDASSARKALTPFAFRLPLLRRFGITGRSGRHLSPAAHGVAVLRRWPVCGSTAALPRLGG